MGHDLHDLVATRMLAGQVRFGFHNAGLASAERLVVELEVGAGMCILADEDSVSEVLGRLALPGPPNPPEEHRAFPNLDHLARASDMPDPSRTDPTEFSWLRRHSPDGGDAAYGCLDFRPDRRFEDRILVGAGRSDATPAPEGDGERQLHAGKVRRGPRRV